jgi:hypothetical protein
MSFNANTFPAFQLKMISIAESFAVDAADLHKKTLVAGKIPAQ